jgi:hypothetical protein
MFLAQIIEGQLYGATHRDAKEADANEEREVRHCSST